MHAAPGAVERFSRRELRTAVAAVAAALGRLGVGVADRVVVIAPNNAGAVVTALAVAAVGRHAVDGHARHGRRRR